MSVNPYNENNLSVADAKAYIASIDTGAIGDQITHYQTVATNLGTLAQQVSTINSSLQATWSGEAADAANIQFGTAARNASFMSTLLSGSVVPALQGVQSAAQQAKAEIGGVQNEVTVNTYSPSSGKEADAEDSIRLSAISQQKTFNSTQRRAAAKVMNGVANNYNSTATTLSSIATSSQTISSTPTSNSNGSFTFSSAGGGSNSSGSYSLTVGTSGGGSKRVSSTPGGGTKVQGYVPPPTSTKPPSASSPISTPPPKVKTPVAPPVVGVPVGDPGGSDPVGTDPVTGVLGGTNPVTGDPVGVTSDPLPSEGLGITSGVGSKSSPGVFDEEGLPGGTGSSAGSGVGFIPGATSFGGANAIDGNAYGAIGSSAASAGVESAGGESSMGMMGGMGGGGGGSSFGGGEGVGSSTYSRSHFLGQGSESNYAPTQWENPAIGGEEGVLIGQRPPVGSGVTSVYAGAQDEQGNALAMMGGGVRGGFGSDEDDDSRRRPDYLKEDRQWWQPEGTYVPPVVE
jgi:hypothetical protein